jgi:hypothetical protein
MTDSDTVIDVTPAGNQLYQIDLRDATGTSRHEIGLPDALLERLELTDVAASEVLVAAVELLLDREGRHGLDREVDLAAALDRNEELLDELPARIRERAEAAPPTLDTPSADRSTSDDRLVAEVKEEQRAGEVSSQDPHR